MKVFSQCLSFRRWQSAEVFLKDVRNSSRGLFDLAVLHGYLISEYQRASARAMCLHVLVVGQFEF